MLEAACRWDLVHRGAAVPRRGRSCAGGVWLQNELVIRVPVGFGLAEAARMEVTAACGGGICFCECSQRRGDGRCWRPRAGGICVCGCNQRRGDGRCWRPRAGGIWSTEAQR